MTNKDDPHLTEYLLGELDSVQSAEIEAQLETDPDLAATIESLRNTIGSINASFANEPELELNAEQKQALTANAEVSLNPPSKKLPRWTIWVLAASLLGLLIGGYYLNSTTPNANELALYSDDENLLEANSPDTISNLTDKERLLAVERTARTMRLSVLESQLKKRRSAEEFAEVTEFLESTQFKIEDDYYESLLAVTLNASQSDSWKRNDADRIKVTEVDPFSLDVTQSQEMESDSHNDGTISPAVATFSFDGSTTTERSTNSVLHELFKETDALNITLPESQRKVRILNDSSTGMITLMGDAEDLKFVREVIEAHAKESGDETVKTERRELIPTEPGLDQSETTVQKNPAAKTWKRTTASPNANRLMIGDEDELELNGMQVNVQIDGFRARVLIDCFYYNDRDQQLEGNFKLRLPDDASLYYFAFGESSYEFNPKLDWTEQEFSDDDSQLISLTPDRIAVDRADDWKNCKEARMVPREKAAFAYNQTMRRRIDPALVEWSGAGIFNARVFPLSPHKMHRIVMGYDVNLRRTTDDWGYQFDLPERVGECRVDIQVKNVDLKNIQINPADKTVPIREQSKDQTARYRWKNPKTSAIELNVTQPNEIALVQADPESGNFWGLQVTPELPAESVAGNTHAVFLLDTSLSSNPDKFNVWLKLLQTTLNENRDSLTHFNVLFFDVSSSFWRPEYVENIPANVEALMIDCDRLTLAGATDLYGAIESVATASWINENENSRPDLFLLSDGAANWGETNLRLIEQQIHSATLGSVFAYQTGLTGTAIGNLRFLAQRSGGAVFSVANETEIKTAATAHRNRPWKLKSVSAEGANDILTAGRAEWVYPGQRLTIVGRGALQGTVALQFERGTESKTISVEPTQINSELASRLYGQVAVGQLESLGDSVREVATAYSRHFRITGETCSLLMLDSAEDYERFDIKPEEDLFVIKSKKAERLIAETLSQFAAELADPKAQLLGWVKRLESMPGLELELPIAFKLALNDIRVTTISQPLKCDPFFDSKDKSKARLEYQTELRKEELNYDVVAKEARRRTVNNLSGIDEAIKVFSCLVESNSGDLEIARDVAFSAIELDRPAQAYPLLLHVARARPYEASVYPALGQCLARMKQADMAIVFYEIALAGKFENRDADFRKIVAADYLHLLRQISHDQQTTSVPDFVAARQQTLVEMLGFETADLLVTMMWNTDQTDVDLHVLEPSGEECSYENKQTRSGGQITTDITTGFGPEMYHVLDAPIGKYDLSIKLFANQQNRVSLRNKVHLTIYRGFGTSDERTTRETVLLKTVGEQESVSVIGIEH